MLIAVACMQVLKRRRDSTAGGPTQSPRASAAAALRRLERDTRGEHEPTQEVHPERRGGGVARDTSADV